MSGQASFVVASTLGAEGHNDMHPRPPLTLTWSFGGVQPT